MLHTYKGNQEKQSNNKSTLVWEQSTIRFDNSTPHNKNKICKSYSRLKLE